MVGRVGRLGRLGRLGRIEQVVLSRQVLHPEWEFFPRGVAYLKFFSQASKSLKNDPRVELAGSSVAVDLSLLSGNNIN